MKDNYYLILGLEFAPHPNENIEDINKVIDEKDHEWVRKANDFTHGAEYRKYHQEVSKIREIMQDSNKRVEQIKEACNYVYCKIDKWIKDISEDNSITEEKFTKIYNEIYPEYKIFITAEKMKELMLYRTKVLNIQINSETVEEEIVDDQKIYDTYYKKKPEKAKVYEELQNLLDVCNLSNAYEFLYPNANKNNYSYKQLYDKAEELRKEKSIKIDSASATEAKICYKCKEIFANEVEKKSYDAYTDWLIIQSTLEWIKKIYSINESISEEKAKKGIEDISKSCKNEKEARQILKSFCKIEKISVNLPPMKNNNNNTNNSNYSNNDNYSNYSNYSNDEKNYDEVDSEGILLGRVAKERIEKIVQQITPMLYKESLFKSISEYAKNDIEDINNSCGYGIKLFREGKSELAMYELKRKAKSGNPYAKYCVAKILMMDSDYSKACDLLLELYEEGYNYKEQSYMMGAYYLKGFAKDVDFRKSIFFMIEGLKVGSGEAYYGLGIHCQDGLGMKKDPKLAEYLYKKACELKVAPAYARLSKMYKSGIGVKENENLAKECENHCKSMKYESAIYLDGKENLNIVNNKEDKWEYNKKSQLMAVILTLVFGMFGIHKFYLGKSVWGIIYIVAFFIIKEILAIAIIIEFIYLCSLSHTKFEDTYCYKEA